MPISNKFRKRIKELVKDTEIKMSDLPKKIGINHATLSQTLNYGIIPSPKKLIIIADYFIKPLEYILGITNNDIFEEATKKENFYIRINLLLKRENLTFYSLAINYIGIDQSSLSSWKKRKLLPSLEILMSIANYFKCSMDYLLGRTDDVTPYVKDTDFDIDFSNSLKD